jgi:hypothetical protein
MTQVIIEPGNPNDFTADELDELARSLCSADSSLDVRTAIRPERGYGVTLDEVLNIWVEATSGITGTVGVGVIITTVVKWAKERWRKDRDQHDGHTPRARVLPFYGPDGTVMKQVRIDIPDGEPQEQPSARYEPRRKPKPDTSG